MKKKTDHGNIITIDESTATLLPSSLMAGGQIPADTLVPKRAFGKTGVKISKLCLGGGSFPVTDGRAFLDEALGHGVDCWEIVSFLSGDVYNEYFKTYPERREKVFLTAKVYSTEPAVMQGQLNRALIENGTHYIDFLAIHPVDDIAVLTDDVRIWVDKAKREKKIRFFGFCTHKNMDNCLNGAAELGWIDGIQTVYNYRFQNIKSMEDAMQRCHEKGIGIFNVKSMGLTVQRKDELQQPPINEERFNALLTLHGISFEQVKLRAIWQNPNLTSICSLMPSSTILRSNVSAAVDERPLDVEIKRLLTDYAEITGKYFCRRCGVCDSVNADSIPIFNIMEMLMYARGYTAKEKNMIAKKFEQIPVEIRSRIIGSDYSEAEKRCPQKMQIARLMKEACTEFNG